MSTITGKKRKRGTPKLTRRKGAKRPAKRAKLVHPGEPVACPSCKQGHCPARSTDECKWFVCTGPDCEAIFPTWEGLDNHLGIFHKDLAVCIKCKKHGSLAASACKTPGCGQLRLADWRLDAKRVKLDHAEAVCANCKDATCEGVSDRDKCMSFVCLEPECKRPVFSDWVLLDRHLFNEHKDLAVCAKCHKYGSAAESCWTPTCGTVFQRLEWRLGALKAGWHLKKGDKPAMAGEFKGLGGAGSGSGSGAPPTASSSDDEGDEEAPDRSSEMLCSCAESKEAKRPVPCRRCHPGGFPCGVDGCTTDKDCQADLDYHKRTLHGYSACIWCGVCAISPQSADTVCRRCSNSLWACPKCDARNAADSLHCTGMCGFPGRCAANLEHEECDKPPKTERHPFCAKHAAIYWWCPPCKKPVTNGEEQCPHCVTVCMCMESLEADSKCTKTVHATEEALFQHLRDDHEFKVTCSACKKPFPDNESARQHAEDRGVDDDEDPHLELDFCCVCDKDVTPRAAGDDRSLTDSSSGKIFCGQCATDNECSVEGCSAIIEPTDLARHFESVHGYLRCFVCNQKHVEVDPRKAFAIPVCEDCNKLPIDSEERKLKCPEACDAVFKSAADLRRHMLYNHSAGWCSCDHCDAIFIRGRLGDGHVCYPARLEVKRCAEADCAAVCTTDAEHMEHLVEQHGRKLCEFKACGLVVIDETAHLIASHGYSACPGCSGLVMLKGVLCRKCDETKWLCPTEDCKALFVLSDYKDGLQGCNKCKKSWRCAVSGCHARSFTSSKARLAAHMMDDHGWHPRGECEVPSMLEGGTCAKCIQPTSFERTDTKVPNWQPCSLCGVTKVDHNTPAIMCDKCIETRLAVYNHDFTAIVSYGWKPRGAGAGAGSGSA